MKEAANRRTTFGWAVLYPSDPSWGSSGCPVIDTVAETRDGAMKRFADRWRTYDEVADHHSIVWRRAYRRGWRVVRVVVTAFGAAS